VTGKWRDLIGDRSGPYGFSVDDEPGTIYAGAAPFPDLSLVKSITTPITALVYQTSEVEASADFSERRGRYYVGRLVAILENGQEVEFGREAIAVDAVKGGIDASFCDSCGRSIPKGEAVVIDGCAYHAECVEGEQAIEDPP